MPRRNTFLIVAFVCDNLLGGPLVYLSGIKSEFIILSNGIKIKNNGNRINNKLKQSQGYTEPI